MAWHTEYLQSSTSDLAKVDAAYPYLTALLISKASDAELVRGRLRNLFKAREAEESQNEIVGSLPYHVVFDPSNVCNLACPLCVQETDPHGRTRRLVGVDHFARLLEQIAPHAIRLDLFNWGEPLLHPLFAELADAAGDISLYTRTSSHLSHRQGIQAERLVSGLRYLVASIDGATQNIYERYRVNGELSVVLRNLEEIVLAKERLGTKYPLIEWQYLALSHNTHEIDAARKLAESLGVDVFRYGGARGRMSTKVLTDSPTNVGQSKAFLLGATHPLSEYDEHGEKRRSAEGNRCRWLWGKVALHPDGGISPCWSSWFQSDDFGNWMVEGIDRVWNNTKYQSARRTACHGGEIEGTLVCDKCAFNRSFVPTPDGDSEPLPAENDLDVVLYRLAESKIPISLDVVSVIKEEIQTYAEQKRRTLGF